MSLYGRLFAAAYDAGLASAEKAGLGDRRRELLSGLSGRVLEIGAGTGLNLAHYPSAVEELVLTEPEEPMARRLEAKLREGGRRGAVIRAPAEALPLEDHSVDAAVATLVLCTVSDPDRALAEVARVLRPGGRFVFLEHVRAEDPKLRRWQDRLHGVWLRFGHGCHCNRPTPDHLARSSLSVERIERDRPSWMPALVRPIVWGSATSTSSRSRR